MHAYARKRVKTAEATIRAALDAHDLASDAVAAADAPFHTIVDEWTDEINQCTRCVTGRVCERCRGRRDVLDSMRHFLVPA